MTKKPSEGDWSESEIQRTGDPIKPETPTENLERKFRGLFTKERSRLVREGREYGYSPKEKNVRQLCTFEEKGKTPVRTVDVWN